MFRDFLSWQRRALEVGLGSVLGLAFLWLGWRHHRPPPSFAKDAPPPYEYSPTRLLLLVLMTFTWALEVCYKLATRQTVFVVNPCHLLCVAQMLLLALPNRGPHVTYLFRFHLYFMHGPWMATLLPVTNTLFLPFEWSTYWLEHVLLIIIPFYLLRQGGYYTVEPLTDLAWPAMTYGAWALYHYWEGFPRGKLCYRW